MSVIDKRKFLTMPFGRNYFSNSDAQFVLRKDSADSVNDIVGIGLDYG